MRACRAERRNSFDCQGGGGQAVRWLISFFFFPFPVELTICFYFVNCMAWGFFLFVSLAIVFFFFGSWFLIFGFIPVVTRILFVCQHALPFNCFF